MIRPDRTFRVTTPDGTTLVGPIRGSGGMLPADSAGLEVLARESRRAKAGKLLLIYEPKPGCIAVFPDAGRESEGAEVAVPLAGARIEIEGAAMPTAGEKRAPRGRSGRASRSREEQVDRALARFAKRTFAALRTLDEATEATSPEFTYGWAVRAGRDDRFFCSPWAAATHAGDAANYGPGLRALFAFIREACR